MKVEIFINSEKINGIDIKILKKDNLKNKINIFRFLNSENKEYLIFEIPNLESYSYDFFKKLGKEIMTTLKQNEAKYYNLSLKELDENNLKWLIENLYIENYEFNKYKSNIDENIKELNIFIEEDRVKILKQALLNSEMIEITKDLVNTPANDLYPETLTQKVKELGSQYGFEVKIFNEEEIQTLEMNAFYAVGKGSSKLPRLIVIDYNGDKENNHYSGFVGKGITYDSGGYSMKSTSSMLNMKNDMGGAATLIGAICGIAKEKIKTNIKIVIPACENLVSGNSYKPGDIIKTMSGLTVEIENTDCEGRMILADAICYVIEKEKVDNLLTIATLTGGAYNTFGEFITPYFSNDKLIKERLINSAKEANEDIWEMPLCKKFESTLIGNIGDFKNSGGKVGGLITSGLFLEKFNTKNIPWCHLDIAGNIISSSTKLATGNCVKTIYNYMKKGEK